MILAQVEQDKTRAKIATDAGELDLKRDQMYLVDARERYKIESDNRIRLADMQLKYSTDLARVNADIEAQNQALEARAMQQVNLSQEQPVQ